MSDTTHYAHVGEAIKARRIELGISQRELSKRIGWDEERAGDISRIETGSKANLTMSLLLQFSQALDCHPHNLVDLLSTNIEKEGKEHQMIEVVVLTKAELAELINEAAETAAQTAVAAAMDTKARASTLRGMTVDEVATETGIRPTAIYAAIRKGQLKAIRAGRHYRVHGDSVHEWLSTPTA